MNQFTASLWGDEGFAIVLAQNSLLDIVKIVARDTSPPGYYFFEHFWVLLFGNSEVSIRSLSFVLFLVTVFFVYKIGEHIWDRKTGIIAAALTFLNPFLFIYAFEGRMYSIMAAFVTASMYFFLRRNWIPYVIATTIALYSHHFAIFAVFVQGLWFLKELVTGNWKLATPMLRAFVAVALLYLPWLYPLYFQTTLVGGDFWLQRPDLFELWKLIRKFLVEVIDHRYTTPVLYLFGATLLFRRWHKAKEETAFFILWFLLPISATYAISQLPSFQSIFFDRYMLYAIPGAMLVLASNRRILSYLFLLGAMLLLIPVNWHIFTHPNKPPFRELAAYVKEQQQEGDLRISPRIAPHYLWESKYYGIPLKIWQPEGNVPFWVGTALMEEDDVIRELPEALRIVVITSGRLEEIKIPGYTQDKARWFDSLVVAWYLPER